MSWRRAEGGAPTQQGGCPHNEAALSAVASQAGDRSCLHQRLQSEARQARLPHDHPLGDFPELPGPARDFPARMPAGPAGPRLAVVPGSRPEALEAATRTASRRQEQAPRVWELGLLHLSPGTSGPLKEHHGVPQPPRETLPQGLLSGQPQAATGQARPQTGSPSVPLPPGGPGTGGLLPGGAQGGLVPHQSRARLLSTRPQAPPQTQTSCSGKMQTPRA